MKSADSISQAGQALRVAKHIVIVINSRPSIDQIVAGISLARILNKATGTRINISNDSRVSQSKSAPKTSPIVGSGQNPTRGPQSRMVKNAILMFAGKPPNTIDFLDPTPAIRPNLESYQDLVVSIKKGKADKLRYNLDDEFAKIHISPFRQGHGLTEKDLVISKGDFNIDAIVSLGVTDIKSTDPIIGDNPEILAGRPVICLTAGDSLSRVADDIIKGRRGRQETGATLVEWHDEAASCLSEMVFALAKELHVEIDESIATALLTGVIESTNCFQDDRADARTLRVAAAITDIAGVANKKIVIENLAKVAEKTSANKVSLKTTDSKAKTVKPAKLSLGIRAKQQVAPEKDTELEPGRLRSSLDVLQEVRVGVDGRPIVAGATETAPTPAATLNPEKPPINPITDANKLGTAAVAPAAENPGLSLTGPQPQLINPDQFNPDQPLPSGISQQPSDYPAPA